MQAQNQTTTRVARVSLGFNLALLAAKLLAGILANSAAMIADAVHSASDAGATVAVMVGLHIARRPADVDHPYGHAKAEAVAAKVVAIILFFTGFGLGWESWHILREGRAETPGSIAAWVAAGAIVVKYFLYRYVHRVAVKLKSSALAADAANHRSDILSTAAALIGIVVARLGYPYFDPLAGIVVAGLVLKMAFGIYKQSVLELMDTAPAVEVTQHINQAAENTPGVIKVNQTKTRMHGPGVLVDMRLCVDGELTVYQGHAIAQQVVTNVHQAEEDVLDVLVHVNPCRLPNMDRKSLGCRHCASASKPGKFSLS